MNQPILIYIVEDDVWYGEILEYHLSLNPDYEVVRFATGTNCLNNLYKNPSVITLDYSLPDMKGEQVIKKIKEYNPDLPIVIVSGQENISVAVNLLKQGVYDYIVKDEDTKDRLWNVIKNLKEKLELEDEISFLKREIGQKYKFDKAIKGNSPAIRQIFGLMEKAVRTNISVTITGETGTGKEVVAKAIHYNSDRAKKPFVAINIPAIPKELIESELFGHEKGAFTGANSRKIGKFELASKGTIFLDEISEMDIQLQAKLLRVLQERELTRIGGNENIKLDVRVLSATNKNLEEEVKSGRFREDLYYRLLGLSIELPTLRDREGDIIVLAKHFITEFCKENKIKKFAISSQAQEKLLKYPWPGNVRELKAVIELAAVMANKPVIEAEDITFRSINPISQLLSKENTLKEYNKQIINHFMNKYNNNVLKIAKKLGVGKSTLYRMIKNNEL